MNCGIYKITCIPNKRFYIGQSLDCLKRFNSHICRLRKRTHENIILQNCYNKHGESSLIIELIELCDSQFLNDKEQHWIDVYFSDPLNMNINPMAISPPNRKGKHLSEETKKKISESNKGKKKPSLSISLLGNTRGSNVKHTDEFKKKVSLIHSGKTLSEETKQRISAKQQGNKYCLGRNQKEETKKKISDSKTSLIPKHLLSPENELFEFFNIKKFCCEHGLKENHVHSLLKNRIKSYKHWTNPNHHCL